MLFSVKDDLTEGLDAASGARTEKKQQQEKKKSSELLGLKGQTWVL